MSKIQSSHPFLLVSEVDAFFPRGSTVDPEETVRIKAIWDTGASHCAITKEVADKLRLVSTGVARCEMGGVQKELPVILLGLSLPNYDLWVVERAVIWNGLPDIDGIIGLPAIKYANFLVPKQESAAETHFHFGLDDPLS